MFVDEPWLTSRSTPLLLAAGHAYPAFYATLPADLRTHLAEVSRAARAAQPPVGLVAPLDRRPQRRRHHRQPGRRCEGLVIWPKLFRRIVPYLAAGFPDFDSFDAWLRADPVHRDDELFLIDRLERGNMHDVVRGVGQQIRLTVWPEDFIISPDPPAAGGRTGPGRVAGEVLIVAALPDPVGVDRGHELVTLLNTTAPSIDLGGWGLVDAAGGRQNLSGTIAGGGVVQVTAGRALQLGNQGDTLVLVDGSGATRSTR